MRQLLSSIVMAVILATGILSIHGYVQTALADKINCGLGVCIGTAGRDTMIGDDGRNQITGCGGDDVLIGNDGNDEILGDSFEFGSIGCHEGVTPGADKIEGGPGNDAISQTFRGSIRSDGHKDIIDCGPGDDTSWINTSEDKDVAVNCETVHAG